MIFPFKWIHTCITCISNKNKDFLDAPFPYIMGVLSTTVDIVELKSSFPHHLICNIDTSQLFCKSYTQTLPQNEEDKIRRKIQFMRHPEIYYLEEIETNNAFKNEVKPKDVWPNRAFSQNIQYIFFRVLRCPLENYKNKYFINNSVFDPEKFLNEFDCDEYRFFWNKIIETIAFQYFIYSDKYIDDSNNIIFENISKLSNNEEENYINKVDLYRYSLNLPNFIGKIFLDLEKEKKLKASFKNDLKKLIKDHKSIKNLDKQEILNERENLGNNKNLNSSFKTPLNINIFHNSIKNYYLEPEGCIESQSLKIIDRTVKVEKKEHEGKQNICNNNLVKNSQDEGTNYFSHELNFLRANYKSNEKESNNPDIDFQAKLLQNKENKYSNSECEEQIGSFFNIDKFISETKLNQLNYSFQNNNLNDPQNESGKLNFYGKHGFFSYISYIKFNIKNYGNLGETYFLKEVTYFLDKEIKENIHLSDLEKFEFGSYNPLNISRIREGSINLALNNKNPSCTNLDDIDEESYSIDLKPKNYSGLSISQFLLNREKPRDDTDSSVIFIEFIRCEKPQYYMLLINYFNILKFSKSQNSNKRRNSLEMSPSFTNFVNIKKLNAVRQYVLELYCKVSKFKKCEYSYVHFYNIISSLDIEITIKYLSIIPEKVIYYIILYLKKKTNNLICIKYSLEG